MADEPTASEPTGTWYGMRAIPMAESLARGLERAADVVHRYGVLSELVDLRDAAAAVEAVMARESADPDERAAAVSRIAAARRKIEDTIDSYRVTERGVLDALREREAAAPTTQRPVCRATEGDTGVENVPSEVRCRDDRAM